MTSFKSGALLMLHSVALEVLNRLDEERPMQSTFRSDADALPGSKVAY